MSTTNKPKIVRYPRFHAVGLVSVFKHGDSRPTIKVQASCYLSYQEESHRFLINDAKWKLQQTGVSEENVKELFFEDVEVTGLTAIDAKGVRNAGDEPIEAFYDSYGDTKKRDQLVRQRRIVPWGHAEMVSLYGPKELALEGGAA